MQSFHDQILVIYFFHFCPLRYHFVLRIHFLFVISLTYFTINSFGFMVAVFVFSSSSLDLALLHSERVLSIPIFISILVIIIYFVFCSFLFLDRKSPWHVFPSFFSFSFQTLLTLATIRCILNQCYIWFNFSFNIKFLYLIRALYLVWRIVFWIRVLKQIFFYFAKNVMVIFLDDVALAVMSFCLVFLIEFLNIFW